jgi:hypothetical protein
MMAGKMGIGKTSKSYADEARTRSGNSGTPPADARSPKLAHDNCIRALHDAYISA